MCLEIIISKRRLGWDDRTVRLLFCCTTSLLLLSAYIRVFSEIIQPAGAIIEGTVSETSSFMGQNTKYHSLSYL